MNGAERKLISIDFVNDRVATPGGIKIRFISIKFSYTLEKLLSDLPDIKTVFKGRAKLHLDPDYNEWKLDDLRLDDRGEREYLQAIKANYEPFISKIERKIERKEVELRRNIANAEEILIGTWRDENSLVTYKADGTGYVIFDSGTEVISEWRVEGDAFYFNFKKYKDKNGEWKPSDYKHRGTIVYMDKNRLTIKDSGSTWHSKRVK